MAEVNEWILSALSISVVKPTDTLLTHLGENDRIRGDGSSSLEDMIVPVLNRGIHRIQRSIHGSNNKDSGVTSKIVIGRKDGQVYANNGLVDKHVQFYAAVVGLYYNSLNAIIEDQMDRMDLLGSFDSQLQSKPFHRALLTCCFSSILKAVGMNQNLTHLKNREELSVPILMETTEIGAFTFLKVAEAFCRAHIAKKGSTRMELRQPITSGLPVIIHNHVQKIEVQLIDSVLWYIPTAAEVSLQTGFALIVKSIKSVPGAWPPDILEPILAEERVDVEGDTSKPEDVQCKPSFNTSSEGNFVSFVFRKLLKSVFTRIQAMCAALNLSNEKILHAQILVAFRYVMRHHISIFNNRHVDQLLLSTIYGICRALKIQPRITFGEIIDAYFAIRGEEQGERVCRFIVRHVKLNSSEAGSHRTSQVVGNIVTFYNTVYVPKMQRYFLMSKSLKSSAELYEISRKKEAKYKENRSLKKKSDNDNASDSVANAPVADTESQMITLNSNTMYLKNKPSNLNSPNTISRANETSPTI